MGKLKFYPTKNGKGQIRTKAEKRVFELMTAKSIINLITNGKVKKSKKLELPFFEPHQNEKNEFSGLAVMDLDLKDNPELNKQKLFSHLEGLDFVRFVFESPSGGIKFGVNLDTKVITKDTFREAYKFICKKLSHDLNINLDLAQGVISKACFLSPKSENAKYFDDHTANYPFSWKDVTKKQKIKIQLPENYDFGYDLEKELSSLYQLVTKKHDTLSNGNRHNFAGMFAYMTNEKGISQDDCLYFLLQHDTDDTGEITKQVHDMYNRHNGKFGTKPPLKIRTGKQPQKNKPQKFDIPYFIKKFQVFKYNRKHVTDKNFDNPEFERSLRHYKKVFLRSIAGSGKSELALQLAKKMNVKILMLLPYRLLVQQMETRGDNCKFLLPENLVGLSKDEKLQEIAEIASASQVVTTYDTFLRNYNAFDHENTLVVIDEAHELVDSASKEYRQKTVHKLITALDKFKYQIFMSATPDYLLIKHLDLFLFYAITKTNQQIKYFPLLYKSKFGIHTVLSIIRKIKAKNDGKKIAVYINNRKDLENISNTLTHDELYKSSEIGHIYNFIDDQNELENTEAYLNIKESEKLPENVQILLTTAKLKDGSQIKNPEFEHIIILNERDVNTQIQFPARFRQTDLLNVYSLFTQNQNDKTRKKKYGEINLLETFSNYEIQGNLYLKYIKTKAMHAKNINVECELNDSEFCTKDFELLPLEMMRKANQMLNSSRTITEFFEALKLCANHCHIAKIRDYDSEKFETLETVENEQETKKVIAELSALKLFKKNHRKALLLVASFTSYKKQNAILELLSLPKNSPELMTAKTDYVDNKKEISPLKNKLSELTSRTIFLRQNLEITESEVNTFLDLDTLDYKRFERRLKEYANLEKFERSTQNLPYSDALFKPERFRKDLQTLTEIFETGEQVEKSEILRQLNLNRKYVKKLTKYDLNAFLLLTLKSFQYSKTHIVAHSTDVIWDFSEFESMYFDPLPVKDEHIPQQVKEKFEALAENCPF